MNPFRHSRLQCGISLIESLVAIVVMALGILGILGVQMRTLADTQTGVRRAQAVKLIEDLSERLKIQPNGFGSLGSYTRSWDTATATATTPDCKTTACNAADLGTYQMNRWIDSVRTLPLGDAAVFEAADNSTTSPRQLGVMIAWRENERVRAGDTAADTAGYKAVFAPAATASSTADSVSCPADMSCHLQYISLTQRCLPDGTKVNCAGS